MSLINKKYYNWKIGEGDYQPEFHLAKEIDKEARINTVKRTGFRALIFLLFITAIIAGTAFMLY
ncbi:MAG: hypothetical protein K8H86_04110 [Ignavibacteriaceae bacterium]|nr:hypothetical protein [Ignavibacteriaceae bacterium]